MRLPKRMVLVASTVFSLAIPLGCGDSKPAASGSTTEATVRGVVKIDGKLVSDGEVLFDPSNYQRPMPSRSAPISKDGSYEIKTLIGENTVKLGGTLARKSPILQSIKRSCDVTSGENTFDLELSAK